MSENLIQYVTAASSGDTDAMAKLYSKTLKASWFLASTLCGNKQEAAEITKKAYATAFCSIEKLKKPEAFEIWMKQNVASAYKETHKFVFSDADAGAVETSAEFLPETVLMSEELGQKIISAVAELRPELKTALVLYYNNGMPVQALAKFLGVSESTANALLSKAKGGVLSSSGVVSSSETTEGMLPVITRLFQQKAAESVIENSDVRDMFIFAIEAYNSSKPANAENEDNLTASDTEEREANEDAKAEASDTAVVTDVEVSEETVKEQNEQKTESEDVSVEETTEVPDNVVMFKQRISNIFDAQQSEPEEEGNSSVSVDDESEGDGVLIPELDNLQSTDEKNLIDFGGIPFSKSDDKELFEMPKPIPYDKPLNVPENEPPKKKANPKMIVVAIIAAIAVVALAVFGISKIAGGSGAGEDEGEADYTWAQGGFSECVEIGYLDENAAYFKSATTGKYGLMDYQGNVILQPAYDGFERCSNGREYDAESDSYHSLMILEGTKYELIYKNGSVSFSENPHLYHTVTTSTLEDTSYDERDRYFEGYAAARKKDKWGYVSQEKDKKVIPYEYEAVNEFADGDSSETDYCRPVTAEGLIPVKKDGKMGIINLENDVVVPFEYSNILPGKGGIFIACKDGIWGVIVTGDAMSTFSGVKFKVETLPTDTTDVSDENILGKYEVTDSDGVNVREGVGTDYDIITELDQGEVVIGYETKAADNGKKWLKIKVNGEYGWVAMSKLEKAE